MGSANRIPKSFCFWLLLGGLGVRVAFGAPADDFKAANQLYDAGKFAEAAAIYDNIEPKTAHVYYNFGNALFREGKLGWAIVNYERARRLSPRDPDILANLRFAEQRLGVDALNTPPRPLQRFLQAAVANRTPTEWSVIEIMTLWLTLLAIAGIVFLPKTRSAFVVVALIAFLGFATAVSALTYSQVSRRTAPEAIVVVDGSEARFAPLPESTVHFKLAEGTKLVIREDRDQWLLAERADGQQGWVKAAAVARIAVR